jgi:hypothetical protein
MREIKCYETFNGKIFKTKEECKHYEQQYSNLTESIKILSQHCKNIDDCKECPLSYNNHCIINCNSVDSWQDFFQLN